jgi:sec-independent protein translocase protein TatA
MLPAPILFAFLPNLGATEMMVIMGIAVMLFGKRLPEVGRSLGKGITEFKKGLNGLTEDLDLTSLSSPTSSAHRYDDTSRSASSYSAPSSSSSSHYTDTAVPKFEPPTQPTQD